MEERKQYLCFFCYKAESHGGNSSSKIFRILSRYLNINLNSSKEVEEELLSCDVCFELGESLCDLLFQWENLRLQLEWGVRRLFETLKTAGEIPSLFNNFRNQYLNEKDNSKTVYRDIQNLREKFLKGCKKKVSSSLPKLILEKIQQNERDEETKIVVNNVFASAPFLDETKLIESLMTFVAVLHLSVPLHPQNYYHQHQHEEMKTKRVYIDKHVQTYSSDMCQREGSGRNDSPPVLTPVDFYNDGSDGYVDSVPLREPGECQDQHEFSFIIATSTSANRGDVGNERDPHSSSSVPNEPLGVERVSSSLEDKELLMKEDNRFYSLLKLQVNSNVHQKTSTNSFNCGKCRQAFETKRKLHSHKYHIHGPSQLSKKRRKTLRSTSSPFNPHLRKEIECPICRVGFKDHEKLDFHTSGVHQQILVYGCAHCSTKLKTVEGFRSHMYFSHGKIFQSNEKLLSSTNVKYSCTIPDAPTGHGMTLLPVGAQAQHNSLNNETSNQMGQKRRVDYVGFPTKKPRPTNLLVESSIENHNSPQFLNNNNSSSKRRGTSFICNFEGCSKSFTKRYNFQRHYRTHTVLRTGSVPLTNAINHPTNKRNTQCNRPTNDKKLIHQCHWEGCAWKFANKNHLMRHLRTHTGEKPFKCGVCLKLFSRSDHLANHTNKCLE